VAAPSQFAPTGYGVPQSEYGGGLEYPAYGSGASFSSKRAVLGNTAAQESIINQVKNECEYNFWMIQSEGNDLGFRIL